jgi:two-component system sensor histidine kinase/response regulator
MVDVIIRNLLSNALKFTPAGGSIELSVQSQADVIALVVADTGIGMDQAQIEKLFRIDVKESRKGTAGEEGTGLGLILCQELAAKNGGKIWVKSEVGKGTTFTFTLPPVQ